MTPIIRRASDAQIGCVSHSDRMVAEFAKSTRSRCFRLEGHAPDEELLRHPLLRPRGVNRCEFRPSDADARREIGNLAA